MITKITVMVLIMMVVTGNVFAAQPKPGKWEVTRLMDTDARDMMEDALTEWGFDRDWVHNAHRDLGDALLNGII